MAVTHNLSSVANNLSGYDPTVGLAAGTTVGRSYILRKYFEAIMAFDSNIVEITNAAPTPAWLQAEAGNILSTVAVNRNTSGDFIHFYMANDPGLLQTPQRVFIYRIINQNSSGFIHGMGAHIFFKESGGSIVSTMLSFATTIGNAAAGAAAATIGASSGVIGNWSTTAGTTTTFSIIPILLLVKTSDMLIMLSIDKTAGGYLSGLILVNPNSWTYGYTNIGGVIDPGINFHLACAYIPQNAMGYYESYTPVQFASQGSNGIHANTDILTSIGILPANTYTIGSAGKILFGKARFGLAHTNFKALTNELEAVSVVNIGLATTGVITNYGGKHFLAFAHLNDGRQQAKYLVQLD
jgi:hypothetical protein